MDKFQQLAEMLKEIPEDKCDLSCRLVMAFIAGLFAVLIRNDNHRGEEEPLGAIIIDPVYKLMAGDENSAGDVAYLCRMFDKFCTVSGASVIFCHHYAKTSGVRKPRGERASGSGVFGRDPDAILELSPLAEFPTGFPLDFTLREFPALAPKGVWFDYPLHHLDPSGLLSGTKLL